MDIVLPVILIFEQEKNMFRMKGLKTKKIQYLKSLVKCQKIFENDH